MAVQYEPCEHPGEYCGNFRTCQCQCPHCWHMYEAWQLSKRDYNYE